jgi:hypothetical protein
MGPTQSLAPHGLAALRRIAAQRTPDERCDFCSAALGEEHDHLVEPGTPQVICACYPCAVLFTNTGETKYRRVPRAIRRLEGFQLTDEQWNGLGIPISMVFFFRSSTSNKISALYPSPAGPTESQLDLDSWQEIVQNNPVLRTISPDVEALLVSRMEGARDYYLAPIDQCYKLTGLIRRHWRGFSGGEDAWNHIRRFFFELHQRSVPTSIGHHA